jgi:NO-binding membrane sensor protein with MHYT domain
MHYAGLVALNIPSGYCTLNYALVLLSGIISWFVCIVGCILMSHMETHLDQQILFSITATTGVAAMHFTGEPSQTVFRN